MLLGISYVEAQKNEVNVKVNDFMIEISQSSLGVLALSSVVWDAGLYVCDFLVFLNSNPLIFLDAAKFENGHDQKLADQFFNQSPFQLGNTLDLGSGTGIVGIVCVLLNATSVVCSDAIDCCQENFTELISFDKKSDRIKFIPYQWQDDSVPLDLIGCTQELPVVWDTIICSDVLYDKKGHEPLLKLLSRLKFKRLLISYKRRHDDEEHLFFQNLSKLIYIKFLDCEDIPLVNIKSKSSLVGLYIMLGVPYN